MKKELIIKTDVCGNAMTVRINVETRDGVIDIKAIQKAIANIGGIDISQEEIDAICEGRSIELEDEFGMYTFSIEDMGEVKYDIVEKVDNIKADNGDTLIAKVITQTDNWNDAATLAAKHNADVYIVKN
jgi:hypothetical protein